MPHVKNRNIPKKYVTYNVTLDKELFSKQNTPSLKNKDISECDKATKYTMI